MNENDIIVTFDEPESLWRACRRKEPDFHGTARTPVDAVTELLAAERERTHTK